MNDLVQQRSAKIQKGGHSCPPIKTHGGLENPPSVVSDEQNVERNYREDWSMSSAPDNIPSDWKWLPLGEFITEAQYGLSTKANTETGVPLLRMTNQENGRITARDLKFVELDEKDKTKFKVEVGDILFNRTNSFELVGRTAMFDLPGDFVFASYLIRLRTKPDKLLPEFLTLYFVGEATQRRLKSIATRAVSQSNISATRLKGFPIPLPPLPEQKKIAHILSTVQRAIEAQERIIQTTTELKKALMHKLFTEGLRNEPQKQTEIGPVPESWEVCKVGDVAKIQSGGTPTRDVPENWSDGTIPWVKTGEINYCVINDTEEKITPVGLANSTARLFPAGTLLMAMYGQGITRGRVGLLGIEAATNQACASIIPTDKKQISTVFLYYFFEYHYENLRLLGHGANQRNMNAALIRSSPLSYPQPEEQIAIVNMLQSHDEKRCFHERKRTQLQDLFRTLLHELMTAKTRVNHLNIPAE